jgi:hypothetical protein
MGIIAGLNTASVNRLKAIKTDMSKKLLTVRAPQSSSALHWSQSVIHWVACLHQSSSFAGPWSRQQSFQKMETLMHPQSAFKNYRESLHEASPPCIPYLYGSPAPHLHPHFRAVHRADWVLPP